MKPVLAPRSKPFYVKTGGAVTEWPRRCQADPVTTAFLAESAETLSGVTFDLQRKVYAFAR
jgi:hypothetical protein